VRWRVRHARDEKHARDAAVDEAVRAVAPSED